MKRYPAYKDSNFDGLGQVPAHWRVNKIKRATDFLYGQSLPNEKREIGNIPVFGSNGITGYHNQSITKSPCIIIGRKGSFGKIQFSPNECYPIDTTFYIDSTATENNLRWLYYLLVHLKLDKFSKDSAVPGINREELNENFIAFPYEIEQLAIAKYLNHKTRLIDTLIQKKQKQIDLLQEQRAAIINQAVTKGLNPDVKMKDSGIEWLGEVPEHWVIKRLKHISKIRYGLGQPPKELESGIPLIRATNIKKGRIVENGMTYIDPKDVPYERDPILKKNEIIVVRSGAYTAYSAIVHEKYEGAIAGYDMVVTVQGAIPKLISYALLSNYVLNNQLFLKKLRAAQPHINAEELGNTFVLLPPRIDEQKEILGFVESKSQLIDTSISIAEKQIEFLKEYRTTLISEVVTGKIDVRDEAIP